MASRCQRSILSCSRCRRRKLKCDRQLPSCSQCVTAKASCTGTTATAATDVPRSITQHLESEIAQLETDLLRNGMLEVVQASDVLVQMPSSGWFQNQDNINDSDNHPSSGNSLDLPNSQGGTEQDHISYNIAERHRDLRDAILSGKAMRNLVSATLPIGSGAAGLLSRVRMGLTPSAAQVSNSTGQNTTTNSRANSKPGSSSQLNAGILRSIPHDIAQRLMRKYMNTIQLDNPFLVPSIVAKQFRNVAEILEWQDRSQNLNEQPILVAASYDFLVVYLVLAISVTLGSANEGYEDRCAALSMSLFEEGICHFYGLSSFPSDIAWLQIILLILLFATVFPQSANVWVLSGAAMRSYIELGLHREPSSSSNMDTAELDLRRRVFWAAYCMDRSICSVLQRPLSTPDAAINTRLPSTKEDDTFLGSITYHKLLSEILHVHFQHDPIPLTMSWDQWLANMERRLRECYRTFNPGSPHHDMFEFNMARGMMLLHRPSPCIPCPSAPSLLIAFEAASTSARVHQDHIKAGFFRRPWLSAHYTMEAATLVLFSLRHGYEAIAAKFTPAQIFDMTKLFTGNFLAISAQARGWPEVNVYASVYERLLAPLLERVLLSRHSLSESFGPAQEAELSRLLYPGPAQIDKLRFGGSQDQNRFSPFDLNLMADDAFWNHSFDFTSAAVAGNSDGQHFEGISGLLNATGDMNVSPGQLAAS